MLQVLDVLAKYDSSINPVTLAKTLFSPKAFLLVVPHGTFDGPTMVSSTLHEMLIVAHKRWAMASPAVTTSICIGCR